MIGEITPLRNVWLYVPCCGHFYPFTIFLRGVKTKNERRNSFNKDTGQQ